MLLGAFLTSFAFIRTSAQKGRARWRRLLDALTGAPSKPARADAPQAPDQSSDSSAAET